MRVGVSVPLRWRHNAVDEFVAHVRSAAEANVDSVWCGQGLSVDSLTGLAVAGREVPGIRLGTSIVPTYPRHPMVLASQARTVQAASNGRLSLGVGLAWRRLIEAGMGYSYDKPVRHLREYLTVLRPLLDGEDVDFHGETITAATVDGFATDVPGAQPSVPLLVAALGPQMLALAGRLADGAITFLAGPRTLESLVVPAVRQAAEEAGRPTPRVVAAVPVCVTDEPRRARVQAAEDLASYGQAPPYRAVLDREGAAGPVDVALIGNEDEVAAGLRRLAEAGATEVVGNLTIGTAEERARAVSLLGALNSERR